MTVENRICFCGHTTYDHEMYLLKPCLIGGCICKELQFDPSKSPIPKKKFVKRIDSKFVPRTNW